MPNIKIKYFNEQIEKLQLSRFGLAKRESKPPTISSKRRHPDSKERRLCPISSK